MTLRFHCVFRSRERERVVYTVEINSCLITLSNLGPRCEVKALSLKGLGGAEGGTRTPTSYLTRPSNVRVCQFRHFGIWVSGLFSMSDMRLSCREVHNQRTSE